MLSPETLAELELTRDFDFLTTFPNKKEAPLILASDFEGPFVKGDPVNSMMMRRVQSGGRMYSDVYDCYNRQRQAGFYHLDLAQEAGDTIIALSFLLGRGVTDRGMRQAARYSCLTPGSDEVANFVQANGGLLVGLTSAPETM